MLSPKTEEFQVWGIYSLGKKGGGYDQGFSSKLFISGILIYLYTIYLIHFESYEAYLKFIRLLVLNLNRDRTYISP